VSHPVQRTIAAALRELCGIDPDAQPCGIDGCSVPTWAMPLEAWARGFARFASGTGLTPERQRAARRIMAAVRNHPFLVAGSDRFCTNLMQAVPRAFVKTGAEGVFCGAVPHAGFGLAVKCDDGAGPGGALKRSWPRCSPICPSGRRRRGLPAQLRRPSR
jgi:L-asparaginase II